MGQLNRGRPRGGGAGFPGSPSVLPRLARLARLALLALTAALPPGLSLSAQVPPEPDSTRLDPALAFRPDTVLSPPGGPEVIVQRTPGLPAVALHLLVRLEEGPVEGGFASVLLEMGLDRGRGLAQRVGARLQGERLPWGIAYTVAGPVEELDYLGWILREAAGGPTRDPAPFQRARGSVLARTLAIQETPQGLLESELRRQFLPHIPGPGVRAMSLRSMTPAHAVEFWNRSHGPRSMTLVAVGDVAPVSVLALARDLGSPPEMAAPPLEAPMGTPPTPAPPDLLRHWTAQLFPLPAGDDPRNAVLALLVDEVLFTGSMGGEMEVQLWELEGTAALVVIGSAYPPGRRAMETQVRGVLGELRSSLTPEAFHRARARALGRALSEGSSPWGRSRSMALHRVESGDPAGAGRYVAALEALELSDLVPYLDRARLLSPLTAELHP